MDPLSIIASVGSLAVIVAQTIKAARQYTRRSLDAKADVAGMIEGLVALGDIVGQLEEHLKKASVLNHVSNNSVLENTIQSCLRRMKNLHGKLTKTLTSHKVILALRWPLEKEDHDESLRDIWMFSQWLHLSITIGNGSLLLQVLERANDVSISQAQSTKILSAVENDLKKLRESRDEEHRRDVLDWLSLIDPNNSHRRASSNRLNGTCRWFLEDRIFTNWSEGRNVSKFLIAHGVPGAGKTVLSSFVIDRLANMANSHVGLAYFYFDHLQNESHDAEAILTTIVRQLFLASQSFFPQSLTRLFDECQRKSTRPEMKDLEIILTDLLATLERVYLVFDAMDEYEETQRKRLMVSLKVFLASDKVKIYMSCRSHLVKSLDPYGSATQVQISANPSDLALYISTLVSESSLSDSIWQTFSEEITSKLISKANEMFLLPVLYLKQILTEPSLGEMRDAMNDLPVDLHQAFEVTLRRIMSQGSNRTRVGISTLLWLRDAQRPLKVEELREALALKSGNMWLDKTYAPEPQIILEACMGLVAVDEATKTFRLIHNAVQEYLYSWQPDMEAIAVLELGQLCLEYLCLKDFAEGPVSSETALLQRLRNYKFLEYASLFWSKHIDAGSPEKVTLLDKFIATPLIYQTMWQCYNYAVGYRRGYWIAKEVLSLTPLHLACKFGLVHILEMQLQRGADVNAASALCRSRPIHKASSAESPECLRLLLQHVPQIETCNWYGSPLHCAAEADKVGNIVVLLEAGIDVDMKEESFGRTALHCAVEMRRWSSVKLLREHGADINARDSDGQTPFFDVSAFSDPETIIVLDNIKERKGIRPFMSPKSLKGRFQLIVDEQADLNAKDSRGLTPLHMAIVGRDLKLARIMLLLGADKDIRDNKGRDAGHFYRQIDPHTTEEFFDIHSDFSFPRLDDVERIPVHPESFSERTKADDAKSLFEYHS